MVSHKEGRTETSYGRENYRKIYAGDIVAWAHLKWGNWKMNWSESRSSAGPDTSQGSQTTGGLMQLSSGIWETGNIHLEDNNKKLIFF